jgi:pilus assembly protein CpaB
VLGARNYIGDRVAQEKARLATPPEMIELVVARHELRRNDIVSAETMAVRSLPKAFAPGGAVLPARFDSVLGSRLMSAMKAGEPLLSGNLTAVESTAISSRIRPGVRAMTVAVDEVNSLSGMLQPGDRIDIILSARIPGAAGVSTSEVTRTVMQDVPVLATGRQSRPGVAGEEFSGGRPFTSITVEVDPVRAQRLVVAQRSGKLTAVLRNPGDRDAVAEPRLDVHALLGLPVPVAAPVVVPPVVRTPIEPVANGPQIIVGGRGPLPGTSMAASPNGATAPSNPSSVPVRSEHAAGSSLEPAATGASSGLSAGNAPSTSVPPGGAPAAASPPAVFSMPQAPSSVPLYR